MTIVAYLVPVELIAIHARSDGNAQHIPTFMKCTSLDYESFTFALRTTRRGYGVCIYGIRNFGICGLRNRIHPILSQAYSDHTRLRIIAPSPLTIYARLGAHRRRSTLKQSTIS